ncbi:MAG: M13 family metallopeptidase [Nitrososphaerota archaeon]|nr:M13 family metallopeptidase [Nitrososphaerota archaeon]
MASKPRRFSVAFMDRSADPHDDFYRYAVGGWLDTHKLPPDKSRYGTFNELDESNLVLLRAIASKCADESMDEGCDPVAGLVGRFYRSAMDTRKIESAKFRPIERLWSLTEGVSTPEEVVGAILQLQIQGIEPAFHAFSKPDDKASGVYAFYFEQGGLSLPDRDYYLSKDFTRIRDQYRVHVARMFRLKGVDNRQARRWADAVLKVETALAKTSRSRAELREREKNYNRLNVSGLDSIYPTLSLTRFMTGAGVPALPFVVVGQPEFFKALDGILKEGNIDDWRAYLCWNVIHSAAPYLHSEVEAENFDFFRRKLTGQKEPELRWKRAIRTIDAMVGEALGKLFVEEHFPGEARHRAQALVDDLRRVFVKRLEGLPWMSDETKRQALAKFHNFRVKIGHPLTFRDYSAVAIDPGDYLGNVLRAASFEFDRLAKRAGAEVDKEEWQMSPSMVNAYFDETMNEIVFPAGILQPPFYDYMADDAVNYGAIGVVIGHEITHGYDDQGRKYDDKGNMRDWWTPHDKREFAKRAGAVIKAYEKVEVLPGLHANGKLTLGENIADLGGVSLAFEALQERLAHSRPPAKKDGLTPDQRFFVSYAQIWGEKMTEQEVRRRTTIDPHSLGKLRAVLPAINHPAFDSAFPPRKKAGSAARRRVGVW